MKRKIVAMMLSVVIVASMITGCGSNKEATATDCNPTVQSLAPACETAEESAYEAPAENWSTSEQADSAKPVAGAANATEYASNDSVGEWYDEEYVDWDYKPSYGEKYTENPENDYTQVAVNPLSTFAADVDTASYSNVRRMIMDGCSLDAIPADAVRTEEIVNFFRYNYAEPKNGNVFNVNAQVSICPWNQQNKLMTIGVNTATLDSREVPDCNIVFLVDVSGSMRDSNKLPLIQKSMALLADNFDENDRISIVTYASGVETVLDGCKGSDSRKIIKAFESLEAGGSTNGGDGIKLAYKVAQKHFNTKGVNRVIVCSDGDFNVGLTTQAELEEMISKKKDSGIFLSTLGFGMGNYSDTTMETLADKGNGNYAYIDDLTEAKRVLVDEMSSTFITVAKDVKLQVEFNPAVVSEYRLVGYENRALAAQDFKDDTKDGGEMGAGHQVTAIYEICTTKEEAESDLKYQDTKLSDKGELGDEFCTVSIAYKEPDGNESSYIEYPVGTECYTTKPSDDFKLAAAAAQASLALKNSAHLVDVDQKKALKSSEAIVRGIENKYDGDYVSEFGDLLDTLIRRDNVFNW